VKTLRTLWLLLLCGQFSFAQTAFTRPSEAYEFASRPVTEWEAALHGHKTPATRIRPDNVVVERSRALCPSFSVESESGEELYWLAKQCDEDNGKATMAAERYLAGTDLAHGPDARLLLAALQTRKNRNWEDAWGTIRTILEKDSMEGAVQAQIDGAIDDEGMTNPKTALEWSKQRYEILFNRIQFEKPDLSPVSTSSVLIAGSDLVHRFYLMGETEQAVGVLNEMNRLQESRPATEKSWGETALHWASLEMHSAPEITVLKELGQVTGFSPIQPGRVEVISFFFLGCAPCMEELSQLDALQKRYGAKKLRITAVTTYEANSYLKPSTHSNIETCMQTALSKTAPHIDVVITSEKTLSDYGVNGFPVSAVVDKRAIVRHVGAELDFDDDDSTGRLIRRLVQE
jgi:thiol-disulfide isomerase/thioredoxin